MDPSLDTPWLHIALGLLYGGAGCFVLSSMLPSPALFLGRAAAAVAGMLGSLFALILVGKFIAFLGGAIGFMGIAGMIAFQYRQANRGSQIPPKGKFLNPKWFVLSKNALFLALCLGLLNVVNHELDRKLALSFDWPLRIALMKGAVALFCSGLFGVFSEPIGPSWEKWPFRLNSVTVLLIGAWSVFAILPSEVSDEAYDGLAFLVLLFQAAIGVNLLATIKSFSLQSNPEKGEHGTELGMNELKF